MDFNDRKALGYSEAFFLETMIARLPKNHLNMGRHTASFGQHK
jgi:hypothetical protein